MISYANDLQKITKKYFQKSLLNKCVNFLINRPLANKSFDNYLKKIFSRNNFFDFIPP